MQEVGSDNSSRLNSAKGRDTGGLWGVLNQGQQDSKMQSTAGMMNYLNALTAGGKSVPSFGKDKVGEALKLWGSLASKVGGAGMAASMPGMGGATPYQQQMGNQITQQQVRGIQTGMPIPTWYGW